jgi:hypothetical protein
MTVSGETAQTLWKALREDAIGQTSAWRAWSSPTGVRG